MSSLIKSYVTLDQDKIYQGIRLAFAAWLAFTIAVWFKIPNPYWAAMPIWVVSQPSRGLMLERGIYRFLGTCVGALFGFALIRLTSNPYYQIVGLSFLVVLSAGGAHLFRGVLSYGITLVCLTAAVIILPTILTPDIADKMAISRVVCTLIGVVVVTIVTGFSTPSSPRNDFYKRIKLLSKNTILFLTGDTSIDQEELFIQLSDIDAKARMVSAGSIQGHMRIEYLDALVSSILALIAFREKNELRGKFHQIISWIDADDYQSFPERSNWDDIHLENASKERLKKLLEQLVTSIKYLDTLPSSADAKSFGKKLQMLAPHRDWDLAVSTGLIAGGATLISAVLGLYSGWKYGEMMAMGVCIFSVVLGTMPKPKELAPYMLMGAILGIFLAVVYRIFFQPYLHNNLVIILSVIPFFIFGGLIRTNPKTTAAGVDVNMLFLLAGQVGMSATTPAAVLLGASPMILAVVPVTLLHIFLPRSSKKYAFNNYKMILKELEKNVEDQKNTSDWHGTGGRFVMKYMLHLNHGGYLTKESVRKVLPLLELGYEIEDLKKDGKLLQLENLKQLVKKLLQESEENALMINGELP